MNHQELGAKIGAEKKNLAEEIFKRQLNLHPYLKEKYQGKLRERCVQDIEYHLSYLAEAISLEDISLFEEYMAWVKVLFEELGISLEEMKENLEITQAVIGDYLPKGREILSDYILQGVKGLGRPSSLQSYLKENNPYLELAQAYIHSLFKEDRRKSLQLIKSSVERGVPVKDIYLHVFQPVMEEVGYLWQKKKISVAREHYCTATTQLIMSHLYPYILNPSNQKGFRAITLSVSGELHELGIRMVADLLEMDGWDTTHLGANTPLQGILELIKEEPVDLLAISATFTPNVHKVKEIIEGVREARLHPKILVGGYPFNISKKLWRKIGADGYAQNALAATKLAPKLVTQRKD